VAERVWGGGGGGGGGVSVLLSKSAVRDDVREMVPFVLHACRRYFDFDIVFAMRCSVLQCVAVHCCALHVRERDELIDMHVKGTWT